MPFGLRSLAPGAPPDIMRPSCCEARLNTRTTERSPLKKISLAALLAFGPTTVLAEACSVKRPNWIPGTPVSAVDEALALFFTTPSMLLLAATILAFRFKSQWIGLVTILLWSVLVSFQVLMPAEDAYATAFAEGCIGPSWLFVAIVIMLCAILVFRTSPNVKD